MVFFQFEADFVQSLRCIPMQVRYKLDTCGVKLKLHHWHRLTPEQRRALVDLPCTPETAPAYRACLRRWVEAASGEVPADLPIDPHPPWGDGHLVPPQVTHRAAQVGHPISLAQWQRLTPLQRFALIKLSRSGHENRNFLPALQEFGCGGQS